MAWIAGVDGCKTGWYVILVNHKNGKIRKIIPRGPLSFNQILTLQPLPQIIGIDIPIGLLDKRQAGGRVCDRLARRMLGSPRSSSVFSPPIRKLLPAKKYSQVRSEGLSQQAFHIMPKIREVDFGMTPKLQEKVFEVHPEISFSHLGNGPMKINKKKISGREERLQVLRRIFPNIRKMISDNKLSDVGYDDMIDAHIAAWTALRIDIGEARRLPENPPSDSRGLRMEIWY